VRQWFLVGLGGNDLGIVATYHKMWFCGPFLATSTVDSTLGSRALKGKKGGSQVIRGKVKVRLCVSVVKSWRIRLQVSSQIE
jgi:hypothetical protein